MRKDSLFCKTFFAGTRRVQLKMQQYVQQYEKERRIIQSCMKQKRKTEVYGKNPFSSNSLKIHIKMLLMHRATMNHD